MMISGWNIRYSEILKEFDYDKNQDLESAMILDSILKKSNSTKKIKEMVNSKPVFVIGAGPSLVRSIPVLKKFKKITKIVADSALKPLIENQIKPDIVVTDLDGDLPSLKKIGNTKTIFVVHAHGDNIERLQLVKNFKNCVGTTQTKSFGKIQNFGGFTDGDRAVFLASHFNAQKIVLFGMDFDKKIGKYSKTKYADRKIKLKKLKKAKYLLEWLAKKSRSELLTTDKPIRGFEKIDFKDLDTIITQNAFNTDT